MKTTISKFASIFLVTLTLAISNQSLHAGAACTTATWTDYTATSATGMIKGVTITAITSTTAPILGFTENHFGKGEPCGSWDGDMPLTHEDRGVIASNVNAGDFQEFSFSSALTDGFFYIENFDSSSMAGITFVGASSVSLVDQSASISYTASGVNTGTLETSNAGYNGEGDAVLQFMGEVTSIRIDYTSGEGANGVMYTFATPCAVPEPTSAIVMAGLFGLGGLVVCFRSRRRQS